VLRPAGVGLAAEDPDVVLGPGQLRFEDQPLQAALGRAAGEAGVVGEELAEHLAAASVLRGELVGLDEPQRQGLVEGDLQARVAGGGEVEQRPGRGGDGDRGAR